MNERLETIVSLTRGPRVLHVGACGNLKPTPETMGDFAQARLVEAGFSVLATDVNEAGLDWMRSAGYEAAYLNAENIDADGEKFDSIVAGELIEHLSNPGRFLDGCRQRLKRDGVLVLSTPQPFSVLHGLEYLMHFPVSFNREHACWYDPQTLTQLLRRHGFAVEELRFADDLLVSQRSRRFGVFAAAWRTVRPFLPARLRTTMVVAARPAEAAERGVLEYEETWRR